VMLVLILCFLDILLGLFDFFLQSFNVLVLLTESLHSYIFYRCFGYFL
jgi:hypothetical protein